MSRLQGWTAFDGLPGPDQVGASLPSEPGASNQQQNSQQPQQQGQRYSPLAPMTNSAINSMGSSPSPLRIQQTPVCPPRPAAVPEEERFLKPVAENKDPNPAQHQHQQQPLVNHNHGQVSSAPHSPPQPQRPIGSGIGTFPINEMPQSPSDLLTRSDNFMQLPTMIRASPPHTGTPQAPPPSPQVPNLPHMPGFQSIHAMPGFNVQFQNGEGGTLRFSRPSSGSPSPSSSPSPFHNHQAYNASSAQDEVAELLASSHLDRPASPTNRMSVRGSPGSPPQQQMYPHEFMDMQQMQGQGQGQSERGVGWQFPEVPPKGYKTVICKFWENNMCTKGSSCTFAHGTDDLKRFAGSGPAYRNMAGPGIPSALKMDRYKTKLCLFHMQSRCCKGPHCPYAHGPEELRAAMPPGVYNALHHRFALGGMGAGTEFPSGPQDDQALRAYVDEFQLQQMMQMQGMASGLQGLQGGGNGLALLGNMPQQGLVGAMGIMQGGMPGMQGMGGMQQVMGQSALQAMAGGGFGLDEVLHEGIIGADKEDIDQQQQMAALKYFERQGQMNSLQQQAQARINLQQQQQRDRDQQQLFNANQGMIMPGGRGGGGPGQQQQQQQQQGGGLPPSVLAYRPVNLWPHGPSWQPEEQ